MLTIEQSALIILTFLLGHLFFPKKDAFFFLRVLGSYLVTGILVYFFSFKLLHLFKISYYLYFLVFSLVLVGGIKYLSKKNFQFVLAKKKDFSWREIFGFFILLLFLFLSCFFYYDGNLQVPRYAAIDASLHFSRFRQIIESSYATGNMFGTYASFLLLSKIFFPFYESTLALLKDFQIYNILLFSLISVYFILLFKKFSSLSSWVYLTLGFLLVTFSFFFNLFLMGFVPQLTGLFLLLFFIDLYPKLNKKWYGYLGLLAIALAIFFTYLYWFAFIMIFLGLEQLKKLLSAKKFNAEWLVSSLLLLPILFLAYRYRHILQVANTEGESYKVIALNFLPLLPLISYGFYGVLKSFKKDASGWSTACLAAVIFFLLLMVAYQNEAVSSYTFTKSIYLAGPFFYLLAVYGLEKIIGIQFWKGKIYLPVFLSVALIFVLPFFHQEPKNALQQSLIFSIKKEGVWNLRLAKPFDIFYFNFQVLSDKKNNNEYFTFLDQKKIDFAQKIYPYLPPEQKQVYAFNKVPTGETRLPMIADYRTSWWFFSLTKIWNEAMDDQEIFNTKILDYAAWNEAHPQGYLIILDTFPSTVWSNNNKKFNLDDYEILVKEGKNYLLRKKS